MWASDVSHGTDAAHGWTAEPTLLEETALFSKGTMRLTIALFDRYATKQIAVSLRGR